VIYFLICFFVVKESIESSIFNNLETNRKTFPSTTPCFSLLQIELIAVFSDAYASVGNVNMNPDCQDNFLAKMSDSRMDTISNNVIFWINVFGRVI
jgi:hypothetical protein